MKKSSHLSYVQKLLTELGDFIFPPSKAEMLLRTIELLDLQTLYQPGKYHNVYYLCRYTEPIIQAAVTANKFHHNRRAAKFLGSLLEQWLASQNTSTILVPVPLGKQRMRQRGHNQVETILQAMTMQIPINTKVLQRRIETLAQSRLSKTERANNIQQVFQYSGKSTWPEHITQVVLVDDVVTTGATLQEARATLAPHLPPNVTLICLALAH